MTVRARGRRYLITRSTVMTESEPRPTYKEESSIVDLETGTPAFGRTPAGEVFFGVERSLFDNTAFIGALTEADIDAKDVTESIENILFSGSEKLNIQRASQRIGDKMETLLHRGGAGGAIYDLVRKEEGLEDELRRSEEDNKQILTKEAELHVIRERRRAAEEKQEKLYELDSCYKNVMLIQAFDKLHDLENDLAAKTDAYNTYLRENTKDGFLPSEEYLKELQDARRAVNEAYKSQMSARDYHTEKKNAIGITHEIEGAIELSDSLGGEEAILHKSASHKFGKLRSIALGITSLLAVIACIVLEIVAAGTLALPVFRILFAILGVGALGCAGYMGYLYRKYDTDETALCRTFGTESSEDLAGKIALIGEARAKRDTMIRDTEDSKTALDTAVDAYEDAKKKLLQAILRWSELPSTEGLNRFLDELEARVAAFLEKKEQLKQEREISDITVKEIRRALSDKSEIDIRAQVSPLKRKALAGINHDEIVSGIADCKAQIAEQGRLAFDVENELSLFKTRARDPGEVYSKMRILDEQIEELRMRHKAYYIAAKTIDDAAMHLREEISPRLGEYATELMGIMTDKKYTGFDVSNGLSVTFTTPDGEKRSADFLSGGTRDLTYIAVRMALIDMLYTETPPITFDESFAHQDNARARSLMRAVAHLGREGYQSFIFTCRSIGA